MNNLTFSKKIQLEIIFGLVKFLSLININISTLLVIFFSSVLSVFIWSNKDLTLDEIMSMTRRKPVLSLMDTIPDSVLNKPKQEIVIEKTSPPKNIYKLKPTQVLAKSYIVFDNHDKRVVSKMNENLKLPPASLVKVLSVMYLEKKLNYDQLLEVPFECAVVEGQKIGYKPKEKVSVKDLINSSIIFSGADSICTLSKNASLGLEDFNQYARSIGLKDSNFTNYIGLDFSTNYTTSNDMLEMSKEFIKNKNLSYISGLKSYGLANGRKIYNTNRMLFEEPLQKYTTGIKTGTTEGANENLIYRYEDPSQNKDFIIIILNSSNRYQDIRNIVNNLYLTAE